MFDVDSYETIVTGGAGFIGSALVWKLNERGQNNILIVDRLDKDDKWKNLAPLRFADYMDADEFLTRLSNQDSSFSNIKNLLHLGACSSTTERDARFMLQNNYEYSKTLAHWAVNNNVRFVYASSAATYGDGSNGMQDGVEDLEKYRPLNVYGYSKHLFDLYAHRTGLLQKVVGLKYFNVFGPNENHKSDMRSLVNKAVAQINETGSLKLFKSYNSDYKDGEFGRDFVYVKDAVEMTLHFVENNAAGIFNVGSGEMHAWNELGNAIFAALNLPPKIEFIDMPEELRDRYQYFTQADLSRLRQTGYQNKAMPLKEAVFDYVQNYLIPNRHLGD